MNENNFIGSYQADETLCDKMIDFFNQHKEYTVLGKCYDDDKAKVDTDIKESVDLLISAHHYYYPMSEYRKHLQDSVEQYVKLYDEANNYAKFNILEDYNIQYYPLGGGFKRWHFEASSLKNIQRVLVFMTYLNDVPDGGTMFKYLNITIPAKKGLTIIWPAGFTHTHKGQISNTKEKYIATGWWSLINE